jgi:mannose-6-phosphate isomerase
LATVLGRPLPEEGIFAESWEACDHGEEQSIVEAGPLASTPLHALIAERGEDLMGCHHPQKRFPLLLKYLDAKKPLSVQVHPDDGLATQMGLSDPGKTEAWCVIQADADAAIWAGFREDRPVDRQSLEAAIHAGRLDEHLHHFHPEAGQCVFLPAGTVHALGAGVLVAEIQQTSDNTFRLFDWNRLGTDGKPRPLHIEEGLEAIDYRQGPVGPWLPQPTDRPWVERLVDCDKFILDRATLSAPQIVGGDDRCHLITVLAGRVEIEGDPTGKPLGLAQTVLLPAAIGPVQLAPADGPPCVLLDAYLPAH